LGRGQRALAFALDGKLFQILARGEEARGCVGASKEELSKARAKFQHGPKETRSEDKQTGKGGEGAVRKATKERLRQHAEQEKINRACDQQGDRITGCA